MPGPARRFCMLSVTVALLAVLGACSTDPQITQGQASPVASPSAAAPQLQICRWTGGRSSPSRR